MNLAIFLKLLTLLFRRSPSWNEQHSVFPMPLPVDGRKTLVSLAWLAFHNTLMSILDAILMDTTMQYTNRGRSRHHASGSQLYRTF